METDLGVFLSGQRVLGATVPVGYRLGFRPGGSVSEQLRAVAEEWGGSLVVLGVADLEAREPRSTLDLSEMRIDHRNVLAKKYLAPIIHEMT